MNWFQLSWRHLSRQYLSWRHLSISGISQLLLTRFWSNFKSRFLGPSWTDSNCHGDICPGNICHGDVCPCQRYLSWYGSDFDPTLKLDSWDQLELIPTVMATFVQATFVLATFVHFSNISAVTDLIRALFSQWECGDSPQEFFKSHRKLWQKPWYLSKS